MSRRPNNISGRELLLWIESRSVRIGDCLVWSMARLPSGHGAIRHEGTTHAVHRLAYILRHGPIKSWELVCHSRECRDAACVLDEHHYLGDSSSNMQDAISTGEKRTFVSMPGESNPSSKLSEPQVLEMRRLRKLGYTFKKLGELFQVQPTTAHNAVVGNSWGHI